MLRTSFAVAFDRHKKGPEEGLSCALLGGAVLGESVASAQGWVPERAHSIVWAWTPLSTPGCHKPTSAHPSFVRAGHGAPSRCRGWSSMPSGCWEEGENWKLVYHDSGFHRPIVQTVKWSAERMGYSSKVTSLEYGRARPGT